MWTASRQRDLSNLTWAESSRKLWEFPVAASLKLTGLRPKDGATTLPGDTMQPQADS